MSSSLHPLERKILSALAPAGSLSFESLVASSAVQEDQARRALQWLASKGLVTIEDSRRSTLEVARSPPELALVTRVAESPAPPTVEQLKSSFGSAEEFSAAFGRARGAGWKKAARSDAGRG